MLQCRKCISGADLFLCDLIICPAVQERPLWSVRLHGQSRRFSDPVRKLHRFAEVAEFALEHDRVAVPLPGDGLKQVGNLLFREPHELTDFVPTHGEELVYPPVA